MYDSNDDNESDTRSDASATLQRQAELRLDALCELVEQELSGGVDEAHLQRFARRIAADVDTVMAEETSWLRRTRCEV